MIGTMSDDGELAIAGSSLDFEYFSKDLTAVNRFLIVKDQQKEYAPSEFLAYTTPEDCIARFHKGKLYEGLITDDADFMFGPDYEKEVCHIGVVNMTEGKALKSETTMRSATSRRQTNKANEKRTVARKTTTLIYRLNQSNLNRYTIREPSSSPPMI